ncbi:MFS transporter [Jannaschia sp. LMIT008]|uniref:MFS transporter n=1 Tax=Jannaschia maritima TaxID=3032585 RepID=UPI002811D968|nr:MFS transporter [Jannaschia sp. LMIT008]
MTRYAPFLALLFVGTLSISMIVPFMGFFLVEGLERDPWVISVYAGAVAVIVVVLNKRFARAMDAGVPAFRMVGVAAVGSLVAAGSLALAPILPVMLTLGIAGFGAGSSALSTMFSLGTLVAARSGIEGTTFNAFMRATTSTAWMIGPAASFVIADRFGPTVVFDVVAAVVLVWIVLWLAVTPREAAARHAGSATGGNETSMSPGQRTPDTALWIAGAFVGCLAAAHFLTFTALPLFFVREVGLPGYAPGNAFSVKTAVEIVAIACTPFLIARFGLRRSLTATAVLAVGAILFLASIQTYGQMLVGAAFEGLYYGLFSTLAIGWVQSLAPDRPAQAMAVYWNATMTTSVLAGPAAGLIAQAADFRTAILVGAGIATLALAVIAFGSRHRAMQAAEAP